MTQKSEIKSILLLLIYVALSGCGGGGGSGGSDPEDPVGSTLNLTYSKAPVNGASAILIDNQGNTVAGPVVTVDGQAKFGSVTFSGPVYASFSGGTYTDEATGNNVILTSDFIMRSGVVINSPDSGTLQLTATPLTEIGFLRAETAAGAGILDITKVNFYIDEIADEFGLDNINLVEVIPTVLENISGSVGADRYGAVLAAISQQIFTAGNDPTSSSLSKFITDSATAVDHTALNSAINELQSNDNTSEFITGQTTDDIVLNTGVIDSDGDGVRDGVDVFPADPTESVDSDDDGVGNNSDAFPDDPSETIDSDEDGVGDNADDFPNDATETTDSDSDGVGDNADVFPNDETETMDSDSDSVGDNADAFPDDPSETQDSDSDGIGDNSDPFPNIPELLFNIIDNGTIIEGYNDGGTVNYGWPVAVFKTDFASHFDPDTSVTSNSDQITFSDVVISEDGTIAAFLVSISSITNLLEGEETEIPFTVMSSGRSTTGQLTIVGLDELILNSGIIPQQGTYSRIDITGSVTTNQQTSSDDVPKLFATGQINITGTIDLQGNGWPGGDGGLGGNGGSAGSSGFCVGGFPFPLTCFPPKPGRPGSSGGIGSDGDGPLGGSGGSINGGGGGDGGDANAIAPGSGGGGQGGQQGRSGTSSSTGSRGADGADGGAGGGALILQSLGGWITSGEIDLQGDSGTLNGGDGGDGGLWLAGNQLTNAEALLIQTNGLFRLDAPSGNGIAKAVTGDYGPILDRGSFSTISTSSSLILHGWTQGGKTVTATVTGLSTGNSLSFTTPDSVGVDGNDYVSFMLSIDLFSGVNSISMQSGDTTSYDAELIRIYYAGGSPTAITETQEEIFTIFSGTGTTVPGGGTGTATESEPNDTAETADIVTLNEAISGTTDSAPPEDDDIYLFTAPSTGTFLFEIDYDSSGGNLITMVLRDIFGNVLIDTNTFATGALTSGEEIIIQIDPATTTGALPYTLYVTEIP